MVEQLHYRNLVIILSSNQISTHVYRIERRDLGTMLWGFWYKFSYTSILDCGFPCFLLVGSGDWEKKSGASQICTRSTNERNAEKGGVPKVVVVMVSTDRWMLGVKESEND